MTTNHVRTKRLYWVDSLKGFLIIVVVFTHAMQYVLLDASFDNHLFNLLVSFMMPGFFAVSGFVNYRPGRDRGGRLMTIDRRFRQLVIPFLLWAIIKIFLTPPVTHSAIINIFLHPDGSFWFLWVLFIIIAIFQIGDWLAELLNIKQELVIATVALLLVAVMTFFNIHTFGFQFIAYYFLFFISGYYINKYSLTIEKPSIIILLLIVWAILAWFWDMHKLPPFLSNVPLPKALLQYMYRFVTALVAVLALFGSFPKLMEESCGVVTNSLGQDSLGIYTVHLLIMPSLVETLIGFIKEDWILVLLSFSIAMIVSWGVVKLLGRFYITSILLLGKIR